MNHIWCERMPTDTFNDALHVLWKCALKGMAQTKTNVSKNKKKETNAAKWANGKFKSVHVNQAIEPFVRTQF